MGKVIISLSAGTMLVVMLLGGAICVSIIVAGYPSRDAQSYESSAGVKGAIERFENEIKYGPVNYEAAKQVKGGLPLFDRIRANRQARSQPQQCTQACYQPTPTYSYVVQTQTAIVQTPSIEYPSTQATPAAIPLDGCKDGSCKPRTVVAGEASKTGAFICSNCRKPKIADWHTDWKEDGTPETYLCKSCYLFMTPEQRKSALVSYQARQVQSAGVAGLLHPESAK